MNLHRLVENRINKLLFKGKAVILYGARQVGKTTLLRRRQENRPEKSIYLNCDEPDIRHFLTSVSSTAIKACSAAQNSFFQTKHSASPMQGCP